MNESSQDWYYGDDPGATCWLVTGADGSVLTSTTNTWSLVFYDTTSATPETAITPAANYDSTSAGGTSTEYFKQIGAATVDGYWTQGGAGYNVRAYLRNADFSSSSAFIPGHEYRFVWTLATGTFDGSANKWGNITLVRCGRCLPKK